MSTKRYLLIAVGVLAVSAMIAGVNFVEHNSRIFVTGATKLVYAQQNYLSYSHMVNDRLEVNLTDDLNFISADETIRNQNLQNNLSLGAEYRDSYFSAKAEYRNSAFGKSIQLALYPDTEPAYMFKSKQLNTLAMNAAYQNDVIHSRGYAIGRRLDYQRIEYVLNDNWEIGDTLLTADHNDDVYMGMVSSISFINPVVLRVGVDYKNNLASNKQGYDQIAPSLGVGVRYDLPIASVDADCEWQYRDSELIADECRHQLVSQVRATVNLSPDISTYVSYINRGFFDDVNQEYLLNSSYLRSHFQYRFSYDSTASSYVLIGGKYSPENEASAYFSEADLKLIERFYLGGGINVQTERMQEYNAKATYYFSPWSEFHLQYTHTQNDFSDYQHDFVSVGTKIVF